eukprot:scpid88028/ scgid0479/ 
MLCSVWVALMLCMRLFLLWLSLESGHFCFVYIFTHCEKAIVSILHVSAIPYAVQAFFLSQYFTAAFIHMRWSLKWQESPTRVCLSVVHVCKTFCPVATSKLKLFPFIFHPTKPVVDKMLRAWDIATWLSTMETSSSQCVSAFPIFRRWLACYLKAI